MKTGIIITLVLTVIFSSILLDKEHKLRIQAESNNVALVQQYDSLKVRPLQMSANDFKQLLPELADSIEKVLGVKLKNVESLIAGRAHISYVDYHYPVRIDTLTIHDTTYIGKMVHVTSECLNQTVFIPNDVDTAFVDFDMMLKLFATFEKERQDKFGNVRKWPFGKKRTIAKLKALCGETMVQDSIIAVQFK